MSRHVDYPPLAIHENDTDSIREVTVTRFVVYKSDGSQRVKALFADRTTANLYKKPGDYVGELILHKYCLVGPDNVKHSWWFDTMEACEDYAVAYAPDRRPDFGVDEYDNP